ncbi:TQXA domain-containing protein [Streptomyces sp. TRM68367]|uniref:TQXA domain-containing protein n=1 Tax=Streptomyces sp. TRM68367 TaxID=2758415 RepID=UPI00165ACE7F|nr:thioester domain-containing protein [Streptomyces sp. TRM68367]MBC9724507.1 thioester domain-containing protein [Streptomyces sp. TRM68367]
MFASFSLPSLRRRGAARLAAATLASGLGVAGVLTAAGPATADETAQHEGGAAATMGGLKIHGAAVIHDAAGDQQVSAGLSEMSVEGGGMLQTYGVDLRAPTQGDAKYHETPWSGTSLGANQDAGRIRWILQHSYPQVNDLAALARKADVRGALTEEDAAAGTQVAIWRYSDDTDVDALDPQAEQLADYLEKNARDMPEPPASLTLDPPAVSGRSGGRLGPVTVHTNADAVTLSPPADAATTGVRLVDRNGRTLTSSVNGGQVFFDAPEDAVAGTAELTVQASTTVPVGRAFTSEGRSQTQILAGSSESTVSATASATWAKKGAIPAVSAAKNCARSGLDITTANHGDEPFTFDLAGTEYTIAPGETRTVTTPLPEDQPYDVAVHAAGSDQHFTGVLDCRTQSSVTGASTQTLSEPGATVPTAPATDTNLAETGTSTATPLITTVAVTLLALGGTTLILVRRKQNATRD